MPTFRDVISIDRSPEEVFDLIADGRNEPRWNPDNTAMALTTSEPIGVGARFEGAVKMMGQTKDIAYEITEFDRPHRIGFLVSKTPLPGTVVGSQTFDPSGDGATRMEWVWDVRLRGAGKLMTPMVRLMVPGRMRRQLQAVKALLERG